MANYTINWNEVILNATEEKIKKAAYLAMQDVRVDVDRDQTVPFRDGTLNDSAFVEFTDSEVGLHYSTPYALKQYYEPMQHYTGQHQNATDHWLDCYIPKTGSKGTFISEKIVEHLRKS